ncbi:MAG: CoA transferase [Deltaproteobacteria bacterium]|nr:MAG: CoA transferase [Deltaproteobacteria bacterium]
MTDVLAGVHVLEVAEQGFVPSAAAVLADWGADVVKVERPEGDGLRAVMKQGLVTQTGDFDFLTEQVNRNKRNVCLDLKHPDSRPVLERLVAWADVFITNQLPQVRRKLSIEPADLYAVNPRLVYARGHGQGTKGPDAEAGGYDAVSFWSRAGVGHMLSGVAGVVMQRPAQGDIPSGMFLAGGIAAALFARERDGRGRTVDLALLAGGIWTLAPDLVAASVLGADPPKPGAAGARAPTGMVLVGTFLTSDGRVLQLSMLATDKYWKAACDALEAPELGADPALATDAGRAPRGLEIRERFTRAIAGKPLAHWMARLRAAGCIFSSFATPTEVQSDPQVIANGYLPRHPTHPTARLAASPVQFDEIPIAIRRVAPRKGEHTDEVLESVGIDAETREKLRASKAIE